MILTFPNLPAAIKAVSPDLERREAARLQQRGSLPTRASKTRTSNSGRFMSGPTILQQQCTRERCNQAAR
ncbi:hypothetical protein M514_13870 [Trichuris suis]|uniref:Uncharacterized protein n=1 Tax=Trichuris suis TaxID=68888 RepID=A0A085LJV7_9BILA|nr:hypothetical protein M513_13870 [Trichuris suis]KFD59403.1 hypothetical protein M514_13870 [Trichuris suis]